MRFGCCWRWRCRHWRWPRAQARLACTSPARPGAGGGQTYTLSLQTLLLLTSLSFLPAALLMMTSFTRIIIVLSLLRQALGTQSIAAQPGTDRAGAVLDTVCDGPTLDKIYVEAYQPLAENRIQMGEAIDKGAVPAARLHAEADP